MLLACCHCASHPGPHVVDCVHFDQAEHPAMSGIMTVFVNTRHAETNPVVQLRCPAAWHWLRVISALVPGLLPWLRTEINAASACKGPQCNIFNQAGRAGAAA